MAQDTNLRGGKSRPGWAKISPRVVAAPLPLYFPRLCLDYDFELLYMFQMEDLLLCTRF